MRPQSAVFRRVSVSPHCRTDRIPDAATHGSSLGLTSAKMFSAETLAAGLTTAYPQDGEAEGHDGRRGPPKTRVSGGSDVSGSPTRFYIALRHLASRARVSGNDRPINKLSILKCCGRTLISLTERSAPGSFASCVNTITASVVGRSP